MLHEHVATLKRIASAQDRLRIDGDWLFGRFLTSFPFLDPLTRRHEYLQALFFLEKEEHWHLPKQSKAWRHDAKPALPGWVQQAPNLDRKIDRGEKRARFAAHSWTPPMQFVPNLEVLPDLEEALAVDSFFRRPDWDLYPLVPAKERSWQLFGDGGEKRLEILARGPSWFERGGLTLERLHCFRVPRLPVHADFSGAGLAGIIISENEAGFSSFCRLARHGAGFQCVVLGDGNAVLRVTEFLGLRALDLNTREIWYLGDVDRDGLRIPHALSGQLASNGLTLRPWEPGYAEMMTPVENAQSISSDADTRETSEYISWVRWLPVSFRNLASEVMLCDGHRAQERVGWEFLSRYFGIPTR